ncbi:MAG: pyridoxamine 5'-phosphate oxidase [Lentimicrobium sp.]|nr:pyridoxamine 5'-phosphate oxidase [Lentimicrobium sp.]
MNLSDIRLNYVKGNLDEQSIGDNPFEFFVQWLDQALEAKVKEPTAMVLSTVDESGSPRSRVVLLKEFKNGNLIFYSNYYSAKGRQMKSNQQVAALFFWDELERQVRINGSVSEISPEESDAYFNSRPLESRIGAVISPQSQVIGSREALEKDFEALLSRGDGHEIKRPEHWGGYAISIDEIEFWQGRPGRLHDRIRFLKENGCWKKQRLAP